MNLPRLGHAIIINNIRTEVTGSARDVQALQRAYETVGFDVQIHTDCTHMVCIYMILPLNEIIFFRIFYSAVTYLHLHLRPSTT